MFSLAKIMKPVLGLVAGLTMLIGGGRICRRR